MTAQGARLQSLIEREIAREEYKLDADAEEFLINICNPYRRVVKSPVGLGHQVATSFSQHIETFNANLKWDCGVFTPHLYAVGVPSGIKLVYDAGVVRTNVSSDWTPTASRAYMSTDTALLASLLPTGTPMSILHFSITITPCARNTDPFRLPHFFAHTCSRVPYTYQLGGAGYNSVQSIMGGIPGDVMPFSRGTTSSSYLDKEAYTTYPAGTNVLTNMYSGISEPCPILPRLPNIFFRAGTISSVAIESRAVYQYRPLRPSPVSALAAEPLDPEELSLITRFYNAHNRPYPQLSHAQ